MDRAVDDQRQKRWTERGAVDRSVKDGQRERGRKETGVVDGRGRQERWLETVRQDTHGGKKLEDLLGVGHRPRDAINWGRGDQRGAGLAKCPESV